MIQRKQVLLSALVLAVIAVGVQIQIARRPAITPAAEDSQRLAAAEREIAELRTEMQRDRALNQLIRSQREAPSMPRAEGAPAATAVAAATQEPSAPRGPEPAKEVTGQQIQDSLGARFIEEGYDSKWSVVTREKVQARLSSALPKGARVLTVDCKTSMCRAEIAQPDLESHHAFMKSAFASPSVPWEGSTMLALAEEPGTGRVTSIAYFAREGQGLSLEDPSSKQ